MISFLRFIFISTGVFLSHHLYAATFYSQATGQPFSNLANWNTVAGGGGSIPSSSAELTNGLNTFVIQNGHNLTLDMDIAIAALTIGGGTNGRLTIGNNTTARNISIGGNLAVSNGATLNVGAFAAVHSMTVSGSISVGTGSTFNLVNTAVTRVCNTNMNGASFPQISGNATPIFNNLIINGGAAGAGIGRTITVSGNFIIDNATPVTTAFGHTITGDFIVNSLSSFLPSAGTMTFNNATAQSINVNNASFIAITLGGGGTKTITGNIAATGLVALAAGVTLNDDGGSHTLTGGLTINNNAVVNFSGDVTFSGNLTTGRDYSIGNNTTDMGTASWVFSAGVTTFLSGGVTAGKFNFANDLTINAGTTTISNNTSFNNTVAGNLNLNGTAILVLAGLDAPSGVTNFPSGFGNYDFVSTSTVRYNYAGAQVVQAGAGYIYGTLDVRNSTKTITGNPLIINLDLVLNTVTLTATGADVTLGRSITVAGACSLTNDQTFTLDGNDVAQTLNTGCVYSFNNLVFAQSNVPTISRTKTIATNITVDGNFTATNTGGTNALLNVIDLQGNTISDASPSGTFSLGQNVRFSHSGTGAEFQNSLNAFTTISLDATAGNQSMVRFNNTANGTTQTIPYANSTGIFSYGNIELNGAAGGGANTNTKTAGGPLDINGDITVPGNTVVFNDGTFDHTIAGSWYLSSAVYAVPTSTVTFDGLGTTQYIGNNGANYQFKHLTIANTGIVILNFTTGNNLNILGNLLISNNGNLDAGVKAISIGGNWTQEGTGIFTQSGATGTTTFNSTVTNQTITIASPLTSYFGNLTITKNTGAAPQTVAAQSEIYVNGNFTFTSNRAVFDATGQIIHVGGNWNFNATTSFISTGSTLNFNGGGTQTITNSGVSNTYNNITFTGAGTKGLNNATVTVNGYFDITGANVNGGNQIITLYGDWINAGATGTFGHTGTILMNGGHQNLGAGPFNNLTCGGTISTTVTLTDNIVCNNLLTIAANSMLDISATNYAISCVAWTNSGYFDPRNGTVTFTGGNAAATTSAAGLPGTGKIFYNVIINKTASANQVTLPAGSDLIVSNDLTITVGTLLPQTSADVYVSGNFISSDIYAPNNNNCVLYLTASSGTKLFDPGTSASNVYRDIIFNSTGATYNLGNDLIVGNGRSVKINGGVFSLNGKTLSMTGGAAITVIGIGAGTFKVDGGATLRLANTNIVTTYSTSSVFMVVGTFTNNATVTTNGTSANGYNINMPFGVFHAKYFIFSNLRTTGILLSSAATIDAVNNISYGTFTSPVAGTTQYIDVSGIDLTSVNSLSVCASVVFNTGATNNVKCTSVPTASITFMDASGTLQGENSDNDAGNYIVWQYSGKFWDGGASTSNWFDDNNWSPDGVPTATDIVYLDHLHILPATGYTVNIASAGALAKQIVLDKQGGAGGINLIMSGTGDLTVSGSISIYTGTELEMQATTNTINLTGGWSNSGTFTATNGLVNFNGNSGTNTIVTGGAGVPFNNLTISGSGAIYQLASNATINGDLNITGGTFDVSSSSFAVALRGDFNVSGGGAFNPRSGTVTLFKSGAGTNQNISGGYFYDLTVDNYTVSTTSTRTLLNSATVLRNLVIYSVGTGSVQVVAGSNDFFVGGSWTNSNSSGFSSNATVYFNGTGAQNIQGSLTTFKHVTMSGAGTKTFIANTQIDGDWQISTGSGGVTIGASSIISDGGGSNTFSILGNTTLTVLNAFPTVFENISLASTSTVLYQSDVQQGIYNVPSPGYGNLVLGANTLAAVVTKTVSGDIYVQTCITIGRTAADVNVTLTMNDRNLTVNGTGQGVNAIFVKQGSAPINWTTGTMTQNGPAWNIDVDIAGFNNLVLAGTGNKTMLASLAIAGGVTVQNGATLDMGLFNLTGSGGTFNVQSGGALRCAITATNAFPSGFGSYNFDPNSTTTLYGNTNQTIECTGVTYGNLSLSPTAVANMNLNNNLTVAGNFTMNNSATLVDNGFNLNFNGTDTDIRTYSQSNSTLITLGGANQYLYNGNGGGGFDLRLKHLAFGGTFGTTKNLGSSSGGVNSATVVVTGTVTVNSNITVTSNRNISYSGTSWTNNGTFNHTNGTYRFIGSLPQYINPGTNAYNVILVTNTVTPGVVLHTSGINVVGAVTINSNAIFDMGGSVAPAATITHTLGAAVTNNGYWTTTNSNILFNGGGTITIPVNTVGGTTFTARDVTIGTGTKQLAATTTWTVEDLTINTGSAFNPGNPANTINLTGDWTNNGTFTHNSNTVNFIGDGSVNSAAINITGGASNFFNVNFSPVNAIVTYSLQSATTNFTGDRMTIGDLATLHLNTTILTLGRSVASVKSYTVYGTLYVNEASSLRFDNRGSATPGTSQCIMTVDGGSAYLKILGTSNSAVATISAVTGGTQAPGYSTLISVNNSAHLVARYYTIEYLADAGFNLGTTAQIDAVNNFSDGIWRNMNSAVAGAASRYYLVCDAPDPGTTIANVTFNYATTTPPAGRYNVKRTVTTSTITFVDIISGSLGSYLYEDDPAGVTQASGSIMWPALTVANWIGAVSSNFNDGLNWSTGLTPTNLTDCMIGSVSPPNFTPVIGVTSGTVICKSLTLTNGRLDMSGGLAGIDIIVVRDIIIGSTGGAILAVADPDVTIKLGGAWTRGTTGSPSFIHGGGTVIFDAPTGTTIDPKITGNYAFGNVEFYGATSSYNIVGGLTATGDFTLNDATINPANGISITIGGNYTNNNGTYTADAGTASTVILNKAGDQSITNATFYDVTVSGSGIKTFNGINTIFRNTIINSGTTLQAPSTAPDILTMGSSNAGTMVINSGGKFDDNTNTSYFNGASWTANTTSYEGTGTLIFSRSTGGQTTIAGGQFNNLVLNSAGNIVVSADVVVNTDINVSLATGGNTITLNNNCDITGGGTGVFTLAAAMILNINGANNYPTNFLAYNFSPTSTTNYTQAFDQTVGPLSYGNLTLGNASVKTLAEAITVQGNLTIGLATLDVSSNNYDITVAGAFNNGSTGSLLSNGAAHAGKVILTGTGAQLITIGSSGAKAIYELVISKTTGTTASVQTNNITILNNLDVQTGTFSLGGYIGYVGGNVTVASSNGSIAQNGTFYLNASSGAHVIKLSGSNLNNLTINAPGITYTAQDILSIYGNFILTAGTFNGNGKYIFLGNNTAPRTISVASGGTYIVGAGGTMALGPLAAVTMNGTLEMIGTPVSICTVTKNVQGSSYSFDINGPIKAQYYKFEYMAASGITINATATVVATYNLSDGTFTNGPANCKYLTISNVQTFTVSNVSFPVTPTGSANNVVKSTAGIVTFDEATGVFSGATFENDDGAASTGAIRWKGAEILTWIGAVSTDWYTPGNWSSSLGLNGIPDNTKNAIIATNAFSRHPTIDGTGGTASCKNLTINSSMILTISTPAGASDLVVYEDIQINGELKTISNNDYLEVKGSWGKGPAGTVNMTTGMVTFNGTGDISINNGTGLFNHLTIDNAGAICALGSNTIINGDLNINAGSLDVSGSFYNLTVKGAWNNNGTFEARTTSGAIVTLNSSAAGTVVFNPGHSAFNILTITGASSTVYTLTTNSLYVTGNCNITTGQLDLNNLTFTYGDNLGTDALNISGVLNVNASFLKMGSNSSITVNSGGTIKVVGTSSVSIATVTRQNAGTYSFAVSSGGTIYAQHYLIEYLNSSGLVINAGATINTTYNFNNGTFSNGAAGGKYLVLLNSFTSFTIEAVTFNSGPAYSCSRTSGTGIITFYDANGPLGNYLYEQDDALASTGLVHWQYSVAQLIWTAGASTTDWFNPVNWVSTGPPIPDNTTNTIINTAPFQPILTANAETKDLTMASGTTLNTGVYGLNVSGQFTNNGGTFTSTGTVTLSATSGSPIITLGTSSFYNLYINGTVPYTTGSSIRVANNLIINTGTLIIASSVHTLTVSGNWNSNGGGFVHGNGTVNLNKISGTSSMNTGAAGTTFYNLIISTTSAGSVKTHSLIGNMTVAGTLSLVGSKCVFSCGTGNTVDLPGSLSIGTAATFAGGSSTINVSGDWSNSVGQPFTYGTSTVVFNSSSAPRSITRSVGAGENFYNLTINSTYTVTCGKPVIVYGALNMSNGILSTTSTNILNMGKGSSANLGSATSYISGPMNFSVAATGVTTMNFPIGKGASWRPVTLNVNHSSSSSATYNAEMLNISAASFATYTMSTTIDKVSYQRYWQINRTGASTYTATISFYYDTNNGDDGVTDPTNLVIAKTIGSGAGWVDIGGTGSAVGTGSITSTSFNSFSKFTLANKVGGSNPLPIELLNFNALPDGKKVSIAWVTATEINNDYFTVERSADLVTFSKVINVNGAGNSSKVTQYNTIDENPLQGISYYRLKQTDFDGKYTYSNIVSVNFEDNNDVVEMYVFPNPASSGNIYINFSSLADNKNKILVVLQDIMGNTVYSKIETLNISSEDTIIGIDTEGKLPPGIYMVVASVEDKIYKQKLIIQ